MYTILALALVTLFAIATVALPLRFEGVYFRWLLRLRARAIAVADHVAVPADGLPADHSSRFVRFWLLGAALAFAALGVADGTLLRNRPDALAYVAAYGVIALAVSCVALLTVLGLLRLVPAVLDRIALSRCGIRGLWVVDASQATGGLTEKLTAAARTCRSVSIVDVTGHEFFVRGPGGSPGLLRPVLDAAPTAPVSVLLFDPFSREADPDCRQASAVQTTLGELGLRAESYMKRLGQTVSAIESLNQERPPEGSIVVRFYAEKPSIRAVLLDDLAMVLPYCGGSATTRSVPCLELAERSDIPSFYEVFRRAQARLWRSAVSHVFPGIAGDPTDRRAPATRPA